MADVKPFRGLRYNGEMVNNMADVVAPPYDVISPALQTRLYERHPLNVIRLILGKHHPGDNDQENVYTRSGDHLHRWRSTNVLVRDQQPAFYLTSVEFNIEGRLITRYSLIGLIGIAPFSEGIILPHEHTFSKVRTEQLMLIKSARANFCPIFGLYEDEKGEMVAFQRSLVQDRSPDVELVDDDGIRHRLWCLFYEDDLDRITRFFESKRIYIADGHHRYESALNYREWCRANTSEYSDNHPANYVMMSLCSMEDPGLIILPAHRLLKDIQKNSLQQFMDRAAEYFEIITMDITRGLSAGLKWMEDTLKRYSESQAIGLYSKEANLLCVLVFKKEVKDRVFSRDVAEPLRDLDVTILTQVILMEILGLDQSALDDEARIEYCTSVRYAAERINSGAVKAAFILNPTKIEQVQRVAEFGLIMPRKSTYFFPKVISGQVLNVLD